MRLRGHTHKILLRPAFAGWNFASSIGAYISGLAVLVFLYVCSRAFTSRVHVAENYWGEGATTLEWTQTSPPAHHTYPELPRIR
jgi:cytochrome c oxidase subunit 1